MRKPGAGVLDEPRWIEIEDAWEIDRQRRGYGFSGLLQNKSHLRGLRSHEFARRAEMTASMYDERSSRAAAGSFDILRNVRLIVRKRDCKEELRGDV